MPSACSAQEKAVTYEISREVPSRTQPCSGGSLGAGSCLFHPMWRVVYTWRVVFRVRNCMRRLKTMAEEGRGLHWTEEKTKLLIEIWSDEQIQQQLKGTMRNIAVYEKVAKELQQRHNITRTAVQCREKIKKLCQAFTKAEDANRKSGNRKHTCPFYDLLAPVLRDCLSIPQRSCHHNRSTP